MPADTISYAAGGIFGLVAIIGICLNTTVLVAMYRGKLFSSKVGCRVRNTGNRLFISHTLSPLRPSSPVYILSAQTILVDTLLLTVHLGYQCPSVMLQSYLFPAHMVPTAMAVLNAIFILFVIVFFRSHVFTRKRTIILCVLQHLAALGFSITSQFLLPCCEFTFSWTVYSYTYITKPGLENYSNEFIDLPLNSASSVISMVSYAAIIATMYYSRLRTSSEVHRADAKRRKTEYRYAVQFATMATVYSLTWIFFRVFPAVIGNTEHLYIYGVVTIFAEMNMLTNSTVYLVNNAEIQKSIKSMVGWSVAHVHSNHDNSNSKVDKREATLTIVVTTTTVSTIRPRLKPPIVHWIFNVNGSHLLVDLVFEFFHPFDCDLEAEVAFQSVLRRYRKF
ncbi:hypothetical protein PRIPAC_90555 [Pristionchus pacificus]|nr:hypothetical protein PRIPAC_90555 [Pristionchus pacificus]